MDSFMIFMDSLTPYFIKQEDTEMKNDEWERQRNNSRLHLATQKVYTKGLVPKDGFKMVAS